MTYIPVSTLRANNLRLYDTPTPQEIDKAYLLGALHDSTKAKYTYRICQKYFEYVQFVSDGINHLGYKSWIYKEGKDRNLYIVEFSKKVLTDVSILSRTEKISYVRGYFDAEGGIPRSFRSRYYIYFAQKNFADLAFLRECLESLQIKCGEIHIPSRKVDPNYYRFFVLTESLYVFGVLIGSFHPVKKLFLRKKI